MRNKKLAERSPVEADRYLRDPRHRARFVEPLYPDEAGAQLAKGTTKLRDGSAHLDPEFIDFAR